MIQNYVLDTDIFSLYENSHPQVTLRLLATPPDQLYIATITMRERIDGWHGRMNRVKTDDEEAFVYEQLMKTVRFCATMRTMPYDLAAIARFRGLLKMKLKTRPMDLRIAAVALQQNAVLVTRNVRDFENVPNLRYENWTQPST